MKSVIGIYHTHEMAVGAVKELQKADFPFKQLTIMGQAELLADQAHHKSSLVEKEITIGGVVGSILGVLNGVGIFAVPGLGFLVGWGALVGGFVGFDAGLLGGGIVAVLTSIGIEIASATKYEEHLKSGKFMVIIQGSQREIDLAKNILQAYEGHIELNEH
jgi:hypothetical protein